MEYFAKKSTKRVFHRHRNQPESADEVALPGELDVAEVIEDLESLVKFNWSFVMNKHLGIIFCLSITDCGVEVYCTYGSSQNPYPWSLEENY